MKFSTLLLIPFALLAAVLTSACQSNSDFYENGSELSDNLFGPPAVGKRQAPAPAPIAASQQHLNIPAPPAAPTSEASFTNPATSTAPTSTLNPFPNTSCPVCDRGLESMGGSVSTSYGTQEIKVCSPSCHDDFHEDPITYLIKL